MHLLPYILSPVYIFLITKCKSYRYCTYKVLFDLLILFQFALPLQSKSYNLLQEKNRQYFNR